MAPAWAVRLVYSFSPTGLLLGTLFFAVSLTPSLIPRDALIQGALSGLCFAAGYGIGVGGRALWSYLELWAPDPARHRVYLAVSVLASLAIGAYALTHVAEWQDSIRSLMGMEPVEATRPWEIAGIALVIFIVLVTIGRLFVLLFRLVARALQRVVPRRVAAAIGFAVTAALFWSAIDGILLRYALRVADSSFQKVDDLVEAGIDPPSDPMKTGSASSLIGWDGLGRAGREFIATGPGRAAIEGLAGTPAMEPIRVYAGLNSADTVEERAKLALQELIRAGGFERSTLVIITPTGTGWVDPAGMDPVEYLLRGDVASVAIQYSYLASWLSLLVEPGYGAEASRALFSEVYGYWKSLPKETRPRLYLYGLSLGAMNSDLSTDLFDVVGDPFQGALWAGPPFPSRTWRTVTAERVPGTPAWLPRFRDGSVVRFTSQKNALDIPGEAWGPLRIVYLQYASDPIVFFDAYSLYRPPSWMEGERGPDVSPLFRWFPVVTLLQLGVDIAIGTQTSMGHGHVYAPEHYIDAWMAVIDPPGWSDADLGRLKTFFIERTAAQR